MNGGRTLAAGNIGGIVGDIWKSVFSVLGDHDVSWWRNWVLASGVLPFVASVLWHYSRTVIEVTDDEQSLWIQLWLSHPDRAAAIRRVRRLKMLSPSSNRHSARMERIMGLTPTPKDDDDEEGGGGGRRSSPPKLEVQPSHGVSLWTWIGWWPISVATISGSHDGGDADSFSPFARRGWTSGSRAAGYSLTVWLAPYGTRVAQELLMQGRQLRLEKRAKKTEIWLYHGRHEQFKIVTRPSRPLSTVMVEGDTKETLRADVMRFLNTEEWYVGKGIPYRRGILLHGPPGCGKTSLVTALAGDLRLPIVLVPLDGDQMSDGALREVLSAAPRDSIILIEDIDCALPAREAQKQARIDPFGRRNASITLSGLLNAIDGVGSQEGRVLFMTTNHIDRLDEALIRPGRVDVTYYLGKASRAAAGELFDQFFIENGSSSTAAGTEGKLSAQVLKVARSSFLAQVEDKVYSFAALQGVLMMARDDPSLVEAGMRKLVADTAAAVERQNGSKNGKAAEVEPQQEKALELQREKETEEEQRNAGGMVLKRLIGQPGSVTNNVSERLVSFESYFPTMGSPESVTTSGIFYYELEIVEIGKPEAQFGFVLAGHLTDSTIDWNLSMGIGDDDKSWAVDGYRGKLWHNGEAGEFDASWESGDVIGLAVNVEAGKIAVSKNGSWSKESGYGVVFQSDSIPLKGVYPAFTAGNVNALRYNVAVAHFKHSAPPAEVWQNAPSEKERNNDDDAPAPVTV